MQAATERYIAIYYKKMLHYSLCLGVCFCYG